MSDRFPPWVILHVPHDSTLVPSEVRKQITLADDDLAQKLIKLFGRAGIRFQSF